MKKVIKGRNKEQGVTLLEVIVTLVVSSIFAIMVMQYMGSSMLRSADPLIMAQDSASLTAVLEKITADYKKLHDEDNVNVLANLKARIDDDEIYNTGGTTVESKYVKFVYIDPEPPDEEGHYEEVDGETEDPQILKVTASRSTASGIPLKMISLFTRMY